LRRRVTAKKAQLATSGTASKWDCVSSMGMNYVTKLVWEVARYHYSEQKTDPFSTVKMRVMTIRDSFICQPWHKPRPAYDSVVSLLQ
jgi:hypothetical protein